MGAGVADLVVDTRALRSAAGDLQAVASAAGGMRSRVGSWRGWASAVGDGRARSAVEEFADRWSYGLGVLGDEAVSLAHLLELAAVTFEAVEESLTVGAEGTAAVRGVGGQYVPAARMTTAGGAPYGRWPALPEVARQPGAFWSEELAAADHPRRLVPGEPAHVEDLAAQARRFALDAARGADDVRGLALGSWAGAAAGAIAAEVGDLPQRLGVVAEAFGAAGAALVRHAGELTVAQGAARRAMDEWARGRGVAVRGGSWPRVRRRPGRHGR